jgi:hypothetical protein
MNILFYGNCQSDAIARTFNFHTDNIFNICCYNTDISKEDFTSLIGKCNIIITQPILNDYRNVAYLSTSYIIENAKKDCKIIIFDSCWFHLYYFDHTVTPNKRKNLMVPNPYHYNMMIEYYDKCYSEEDFINNCVNNEELKTTAELEVIVKNSINELKLRYKDYTTRYKGDNIYYICTAEFIQNNYKENLLFYTPNHPSKYLIQFICKEILKIMQIEDKNIINYNYDKFYYSVRCILYKCIQKMVNFDITKHTAYTINHSSSYGLDNYTMTKLYYDAYKKLNIL